MTLISKKVLREVEEDVFDGFNLDDSCECCEEINNTGLIEILAQEIKDIDANMEEVVKDIEEIDEVALKTVETYGTAIMVLKKMIDMVAEKVGVEFQIKPAVDAELVLVEKTVTKKKKK